MFLIRIQLFIVAVMLFSAPALEACQCSRIGEPCEMAGGAAAVFLGKVVKLATEDQKVPQRPNAKRLVTFQIAENFRGAATGTIEVVTGMGNGDCGYDFRMGRQYLVYASRAGNVLYTGICSRTALSEKAATDLAYLRSLATGGPPSRVYGFVTRDEPLVYTAIKISGHAPLPVANVPIHLQSQNTNRQTITNAAGNYAFENLPPGEFILFADMPNNWGGGERRTVRLRAHECSGQIFVAVERAQLSGRLLDDRQRPSVTTEVAMVSLNGSNQRRAFSDFTDPQGFFTIRGLPPGDYLLGINISQPPREGPHLSHPFWPTYFPGVPSRAAAKVIHLQSGQQLSGFEMRLPPPLKQRTITGRVTWPDGKPAFGAYVELKDSEFVKDNVDLGSSRDDGTFTVTGVQGRLYSLSAVVGIRDGERPFHSKMVQLKAYENGPVVLVLSLPGK